MEAKGNNWMFALRGDLTRKQSIVLSLIGFLVFIAVWWILAEVLSIQKPVVDQSYMDMPVEDGGYVNVDSLARIDSIAYANATEFTKVYPYVPPPTKVLASYSDLITKDKLLENAMTSIWLNLQGYIWAILISIPFGFLIGLVPLFRGLFSKQVDAMRYLPLTALTGLFIVWFGIDAGMKVAFLAFGIIVYLLPVVVQRIWEVSDVYLKTVHTLGATAWQTIKTVYIPAVMTVLFEDIRVLTAISWTYIIVAELVQRAGGIGSLIYIKSRQGQIERVFGILIVIILIGLIQDRIFAFMGRRLFPHKNFKSMVGGIKESRFGVLAAVLGLALLIMISNVLGLGAEASGIGLAVVLISSIAFILYGEYLIKKSTQTNG